MSKTYNIDTKDDYLTVLDRLRQCLDEKQFLRFENKPGKLFEGNLQGNSFRIRRITEYRKSYIPLIKGDIKKTSNGTNIKISMSENVMTSVFLFIWFLLLIFISILILNSMALSPLSIILLLGLIIVGVVVYYFTSEGINKEFKNSRILIGKILKGEV